MRKHSFSSEHIKSTGCFPSLTLAISSTSAANAASLAPSQSPATTVGNGLFAPLCCAIDLSRCLYSPSDLIQSVKIFIFSAATQALPNPTLNYFLMFELQICIAASISPARIFSSPSLTRPKQSKSSPP